MFPLLAFFHCILVPPTEDEAQEDHGRREETRKFVLREISAASSEVTSISDDTDSRLQQL